MTRGPIYRGSVLLRVNYSPTLTTGRKFLKRNLRKHQDSLATMNLNYASEELITRFLLFFSPSVKNRSKRIIDIHKLRRNFRNRIPFLKRNVCTNSYRFYSSILPLKNVYPSSSQHWIRINFKSTSFSPSNRPYFFYFPPLYTTP